MPPPDSLPWRVLHVPKQGHSAEEYEDAWAADPARHRFAVADGASEASYSGLWAQLLTEAFVTARRPWAEPDWLDEARRAWSAQVDNLDLSWYAEMKRTQGAYAAFLGLSVRPPSAESPGRWRALAVGDSCLLRIRPGDTPRTFPLQRSEAFSNQPQLLGSRPAAPPAFATERGSCLPGDRLYLLTDALAHWFLLRCENGHQPWDDLAALFADAEGSDVFPAWVETRRDQQALRNDDVTVLAIGPIPSPLNEASP
jgi:hypothetical protein